MPSVLPNVLLDAQAALLLAAPVVVAAALTGYLVARRLHVDRRNAAIRAAAVVALAMHLVAVAVATRLVQVIAGGDAFATRQVELIPLAGISGYLRSGASLTVLLRLGGNIVLLLPLGVLIPLVIGRDPGWRPPLLFGIAASATIETFQWWFALGVASVDDVALNVSGVAVGYLAYLRLIRRHVHRRPTRPSDDLPAPPPP